MQVNEVNQYHQIFKTSYNFNRKEINSHIEKLKDLDKVLPPSTTFLLVTNTMTGQFEFISKNFTLVTGLDKNLFLKNGVSHYMSLVHPDEINTWLQILQDLMKFYLTNYSAEELNRLDFQYNYRLKIADGRYLNLIENQVNLLADDTGRPVIGMGHFTVIGEGDCLPMRATARILNKNNEYETVFHKVYGSNLIEKTISPRERDIIRLIALGHNNKEIGEKLFISHHTVKTHRKNIMAKTGSKNITALVVECMKQGLV